MILSKKAIKMTSLIRNLKNERKAVKYGFKLEGDMLCTQEATDTTPAVMTKFPLDIGIIKRSSNLKLINKRLEKAQDEYYEKHKGYITPKSERIKVQPKSLNEFIKLLFNRNKKNA
jgi:hypothetical protein